LKLNGSSQAERRGALESYGQLEAPEQAKALAVKEADCLEVSRDRPYVDVFDAQPSGLGDSPLGEGGADSKAAMPRIDNDGLQFRLLAVDEQATEAENLLIALGDPKAAQRWLLQVGVELAPRIGAAEHWIVIDFSVALSQAAPELSTSF
jgi:hypothetical protein